ncbi:MAG: hypothetical protein NC085_13640, partial [Muribaculaceae bacterium]|nr:hypothetical protein [Muribaculaceae bacterium]
IENGAKIGKINKIFEDSFSPYMLTRIAVCAERGKIPQNKNKEKILLEYLQKYYKIMSAPYVTKEDLSNAGFSSKRSISKAYNYAHKLRLNGVEKSETLQKTINYMNNSKDVKQTCEV